MTARSYIPLLPVILLAALLIGCSTDQTDSKRAAVYQMGENVQLGKLIYTVVEANWHDRIGEGMTAREPKSRYLAVTLQATNSGAETEKIPPLRLEDGSGNEYPEVSDGRGVPNWLGVIRSVKPGSPVSGTVIFDAPRGPYKLRIPASEYEPDGEVALIEIPPAFEVSETPLIDR